MTHQSKQVATFIGFIAILLWATLALFTTLTKGIAPFQLLFLSFFIGASINLLWLILTRQLSGNLFNIPKQAWLLSVSGLFFYHFFYFNALARAPEVEAGLIAYLWPLLIVVFSALLPGEHLRANHMIGALLAFSGTAALILFKGGKGIAFESQYLSGYLFALACALTWSLYSVFNRRFARVPSATMAGFCYVVALLGLLSHILSDETWHNPTLQQWIGILGLGIGPVGIAFFVWDYGTKHGNIQILGTLSYFAPLLSTLLLIFFTAAELTINVLLGCGGIIVGAIIAVLPKR
ncbi:MAG: EamA family transporter [Gammaproteobacteria bacterium]|nr:MAG: EamA family transporter [Gammaproteobacteria bacterium]